MPRMNGRRVMRGSGDCPTMRYCAKDGKTLFNTKVEKSKCENEGGIWEYNACDNAQGGVVSAGEAARPNTPECDKTLCVPRDGIDRIFPDVPSQVPDGRGEDCTTEGEHKIRGIPDADGVPDESCFVCTGGKLQPARFGNCYKGSGHVHAGHGGARRRRGRGRSARRGRVTRRRRSGRGARRGRVTRRRRSGRGRSAGRR